MCNFVSLSLEISYSWFSSYFSFQVFGFFFCHVLFYQWLSLVTVISLSLIFDLEYHYWCVNAVCNISEFSSSFFSCYIYFVYVISRPCVLSSIFLYSLSIHLFLPCPFWEWFRVSNKGVCPDVNFFDDISAAELDFEQVPRSFEVFFSYFFFHFQLCDGVCFQYFPALVSSLFSKNFDFFLDSSFFTWSYTRSSCWLLSMLLSQMWPGILTRKTTLKRATRINQEDSLHFSLLLLLLLPGLAYDWALLKYIRCPWCNGYRRRKWTRRHEFKSWTRLIAFHIALIPLQKVWIQLFSLQLWVNSRTDWVLQPWWGN